VRHRVSAALAALAVGVLLAGCGGSAKSATPNASTNSPAPLHGFVPGDSPPKPEFRLFDTSGHPFDFVADTAGKAVFLYFGYTHCPDECPTSMADVASALRRTDAAVRSKVAVVFVTTDPRRDSAARLRAWLDKFDSSFIGLRGTINQIGDAELAMHVPLAKEEAAPKSYGSGRYSVTHFAAVLAFGRDGRLATLYPSGITPAEIAADLPALVKG